VSAHVSATGFRWRRRQSRHAHRQAPGVREPVLQRPFAHTAGRTLFNWFIDFRTYGRAGSLFDYFGRRLPLFSR